MTAVTISRQLGSLGRPVAQAVGQRLGFRVVDRELINQAAARAGAPEMALAMIDELGLLGLRPSPKACLAYRQAVRQVMEELAAEGNVVLLGRAGQVILRKQPDVLHVRVIAPLEMRINRVAAAQHIPSEAARAQVTASDENRRSYLRRCYKVDWESPDLYDLVVNTGWLPAEAIAELICQALAIRQRYPLPV
jgi:cytidylate kinase